MLNFFAEVLDLLQLHQLGKSGYLDPLFQAPIIDFAHQLCDSLTLPLVVSQT